MRLPFLKNFRRGFATNSSSSHSFVYFKEVPADAYEDITPGSYPENGEFGWQDFKLTKIKDKIFYYLVSKINDNWGMTSTEIYYKDHKDEFPEMDEIDFYIAAKGYVDHQSQGTVDLETARDPYVVIFGGNDNSDGSIDRYKAVQNGLIDWTKTEIEYEDIDAISDDDIEAQKVAVEYIKKKKYWFEINRISWLKNYNLESDNNENI